MSAYDTLEFDLLLDDFINFDDYESNSTTTEDISIEDEHSTKKIYVSSIKDDVIKPKKKRIRKKKVIPIAPGPIVVKNDIRRTYANMFINVLNTCDFHLLYGMLDTFFVPNFQQTFKKTTISKSDAYSLMGINRAAQHWFTSFIMAPDVVLQLKNTDVIYGSGKIMAKIALSATKIYEDPICMASYHELIEQNIDHSNSTSSNNEKRLYSEYCGKNPDSFNTSVTIGRIIESVSRTLSTLAVRPTPEVTKAEGTLLMHTDENKRITFMEIIADFTT